MKKQTGSQRKRSETQFRNVFKQIIDKKIVKGLTDTKYEAIM